MGSNSARLEQVRQHLRLSKADFARLMGIKPNYYTHISTENGRGNLRIEHLEALLVQANVNPVWVLTGVGEMFVSNSNVGLIEGEPTEAQIEELYQLVVKTEGRNLTIHNSYKLKLACAQCFIDYPEAQNLRELSFAARVYFRLLERLPQVDIITALGFQNEDTSGDNK